MIARDVTELCRTVAEAAVGDEAIEAFADEGRRTQVRVRGGEVEALTFAESRGVGVRVIDGGRVGYAYAADPSVEDVAALVASAREAAGFAERDPANQLPSLGPVEPMPELFREEQAAEETGRKVDLALSLERAAVSAHPEVRKVESASYGDAVSRVVVASTTGGPVEYARTDCWAAVSSLAERGGETQTGFAYRLARETGELAWEEAAGEAAERAARLLGGVKPETARVPVVLDPVASTAFLGVLASALSAESVLKGRSLLAGRLGERVGDDLLTIIDDGRLPEGPAAAPFDDEGVPTARTALVQAGVLTGYLHNTYTATRMGERSSGNAARGSHRTAPGVGPTNLFVVPGSDPLDDLLARAGSAVFVQDVTGLHSGANPVSGEFSVGAVGLRVEAGALAGALREMTIASTLPEVLDAVAGLGSDLRFFGGGLGAPTILVREMTVAGS